MLFIFILIGLQMPGIIDEMSPEAIKSGLGYAVIIGGAIVLTRFVWTFTWTISRLYYLRVSVKRQTLTGGEPLSKPCGHARCILCRSVGYSRHCHQEKLFPHRDMIIFVTFIIILLTLVGQGFLLL
jgi:CPA1 family monovalent cation:H+ antiporter